ncbi:uncharacterized protein LOC9640231 [Selaginella moellendorffii]|uniref:uncharacterized protein LOC9640231 n=1 Tax=Selaginella moellendorffii TaxID=88036 RepID=UPI000D1CA5F2|nr:uncharacterized protein LOC9640231 [Selaginella moellendorffii]|eukprot:XP_002971502.2 uncharacterized protein LOC9640231 [Selaginella moellendorffii]
MAAMLKGVKEEAARAVVRDAAQRGHTCIELRRDGKRPIFFCLVCGTRSYNDDSLWNHLKGNLHARHLAGSGLVSPKPDDERQGSEAGSIVGAQKRIYGTKNHRHSSKMEVDSPSSNTSSSLVAPLNLVALPELPLQLVDQGQMFVKVRPGAQFVEACWLEKRVLVKQQQSGQAEYGLVVFPYSEGLGKGVVLCSSAKEETGENNSGSAPRAMAIVEQQAKKGTRGRKRTKQTERICFICRQKMVAGKDVATLLNMSNRQMMCHSRNWLGAFHVYHTYCLINWILLFDAKFWMGHSLHFSRNFRKSLQSVGQQHLNHQDKPIFCPECQGTGFRFNGGHLEPPRYRLAQIFDWVLELVQARKVWIDRLGQEITGLMFHASSKGIGHPRDFESSLVLPRGMLRFFYSQPDSKLDVLRIDNDGTASMEVDV